MIKTCRYCMILYMVDYLDLPSMFGSLSTSVESILYCRIWLRMHFVWNRLTGRRSLLALNPCHDLWRQCLCHQYSGGAELIIYILPSHSSAKWAVQWRQWTAPDHDCPTHNWTLFLDESYRMATENYCHPSPAAAVTRAGTQHAENNKKLSELSWIFHTLKVKKYTEVPGSDNK